MKNILKITTLIIFCALTFSASAQVEVIGVPVSLDKESVQALPLQNQFIEVNVDFLGENISRTFLSNIKDSILINTDRWPLAENKDSAELLISFNVSYDEPSYEIIEEGKGKLGTEKFNTYQATFVVRGKAKINLTHTDLKRNIVFFNKSDDFFATQKFELEFKTEALFKDFIANEVKWKKNVMNKLEDDIYFEVQHRYYNPYLCPKSITYLSSFSIGKKKKEKYKDILAGYDILKKVTTQKLLLDKLDRNTVSELNKAIELFEKFLADYDPAVKKKLGEKINYQTALINYGVAQMLLSNFSNAYNAYLKSYFVFPGLSSSPDAGGTATEKIRHLNSVKHRYAGLEYLKLQEGKRLSDKYKDAYLMKRIFISGGGTVQYIESDKIVKDDALAIGKDWNLYGANNRKYDLSKVKNISFHNGQINFTVKKFKKQNRLMTRINPINEKIALYAGRTNGYVASTDIDYYAEIPGQSELKKINSMAGGGTKPLLKKEAENCDWLKKVIKEKNRKYVVSLGENYNLKPYFWINMAKGYTENCK